MRMYTGITEGRKRSNQKTRPGMKGTRCDWKWRKIQEEHERGLEKQR